MSEPERLAYCLTDSQWLSYWLVCLLNDCLVGWLVNGHTDEDALCLGGRLAGWLTD